MTYRLVCLTHGDSGPLLRTVESFIRHVSPAPSSAILVIDGPLTQLDVYNEAIERLNAAGCPRAEFVSLVPQRGFCGATRFAWNVAAIGAESGTDYVFWLEHDFVFLRDVDLASLARVTRLRRLAQMSLCRGAANDTERAAGGLVEAYSGRMRPFVSRHGGGARWLEHEAYWTTNPSLIPMRVLAEPWPAEAECEGKFGAQLREAGVKFGLWGDGTPWVDHVGVRDGFGY